MKKTFDFGAVLKNNENKHKKKPSQFNSVAGGIQKRLETTIKNRKSNRLSIFDKIRDLPRCESPPPISEAKLQVEHRRQQLEKWKAEKEQKKKEIAAHKKKPFITAVARSQVSLKYVPPLPPPPRPNASGRVTRSQTRSLSAKPKNRSPVESSQKLRNKSFAPKNASFKPPELKNIVELPTLRQRANPKNRNVSMVTFNPVMPKTASTVKQTRSKAPSTHALEVRSNPFKQVTTHSTRSTATKKPLLVKQLKMSQSSSSSSDMEATKTNKRIKTPAKKLLKVSTSENSSSDSSTEKFKMKRVGRKTMNFNIDFSSTSSEKVSSEADASPTDKQMSKSKTKKSLPKNTRRSVASKTSSGNNTETSPVILRIDNRSPIYSSKKSLPNTPHSKKRIPRSESSSEEKLRSPKSPIQLALTPEQMESAKISPCVTLSRGKENARNEMKWKMDEGYLDDDVSDMDSIDHFRHQLSSEVKRLTEMCDTWDRILAQTVLPEAVQEAVLAAVGQGRLLTSQKLQQFASLVERCARPEPGSALVTPTDLHGFWDMVFMQVTNVDMRFKKLEELRARNWTEEKIPEQKKVVTKAVAKKTVKPASSAGGPSKLKEMIAAARKAKKIQEMPLLPAASPPAVKTFEAGFFTVSSPLRSSPRSPLPLTPNKSLLKAVLSSEAKKASSKNSTPFAMLRASIMAKNVECDGIALLPQTPPLTQVNLFATPGPSILKSANVQSDKKSVKIVLFDNLSSDMDQSVDSEKTNSDKYQTSNEQNQIPDISENDKENITTPLSVLRTRRQRKSLLNVFTEEIEVLTPRRSSRNKKIDDKSKETKSNKNTPKLRPKKYDMENTQEVTESNEQARSELADSAKEVKSKKKTPKTKTKKNVEEHTLKDTESNDQVQSELADTPKETKSNKKTPKIKPKKIVEETPKNNDTNKEQTEIEDAPKSGKSDRKSQSEIKEKRKRLSRNNALDELEANVMDVIQEISISKRPSRSRRSKALLS